MSRFKQTLTLCLDNSKIPYDEKKIDNCETYYKYVMEANKHMNLTRITDENQAATMHFANALELLKAAELPRDCRLIDIGTGAGFPGIPLKLLRPDIDLTLLDSSRKKIDFIKNTTEKMGLEANLICSRAEEAVSSNLRESFGVVCSCAVAPLDILSELCVPYLRVGGVFAAWKGEKYLDELEDAKTALDTLGCSALSICNLGKGALILIEKQKPTPEIYPRRFAKIKSNPL